MRITLFLLIFLLTLAGCDDHGNTANVKKPTASVITVVEKSPLKHLYFRGVLNPLKNILVLSPVDGHVIATHFVYGEEAHQGDTLVTIDATELSGTYRNDLSDYLQKKAALETQQAKLSGDRELFAAGVISQQEFDDSRNSYATNLMQLTQARFQLEKVLQQGGMKFSEVEQLKLEDVQRVAAALQRSFSQVEVKSPEDGVVLIPTAASGDEEVGKSKALELGTSVKASQAILSIGDLSGFSMNIGVSELDILQIKKGLKATLTGDAFPNLELQGVVSQVAIQANPSQNAGGDDNLSMYQVTVVVPTISAEQKKKILVGMTAKIDIAIQEPASIMIPLSAVTLKNGRSYVTVQDKNTGEKREVLIETGDTTPTEVTVISGLSVGDTLLTF